MDSLTIALGIVEAAGIILGGLFVLSGIIVLVQLVAAQITTTRQNRARASRWAETIKQWKQDA